jgi:hypothetical protein
MIFEFLMYVNVWEACVTDSICTGGGGGANPPQMLDTGQNFLEFFLTTHKNINRLVSVSFESPVC